MLSASLMGMYCDGMLFLVEQIHVRGCFILPFVVALDGDRYLCNISGFIIGMPSNCSLCIDSMRVSIGGQKNDLKHILELVLRMW